MSQLMRLPEGGAIDRSKPLRFTFEGKSYTGFQGDTLASALMANGVKVVGRSFKYHRPRGIFSAGSEEPNALVTLNSGARKEPNARATTVELHQDLEVHSQNCWPSANFDLMAVNDLFKPFFNAGFYYKTFMWPTTRWEFYEKIIRRAAGMGKPGTEADADVYDKCHDFCDVLIVGAGPAGLSAAIAAGRSGARVLLVDEQPQLGGQLLWESGTLDGKPAKEWVAERLAEIAEMPDVCIKTRTSAWGVFDGRSITLLERVTDHLGPCGNHMPRQKLWTVRAEQVVYACGAIERPIVFANNDRPGVMLASAARRYVNEYAVKPGYRVVVFTNNDSAYAAAVDMANAGVEVKAIVDSRGQAGASCMAAAKAAGLTVYHGHVVTRAKGRMAVKAACIAQVNDDGRSGSSEVMTIECDSIAVSGGWTPMVQLQSQCGTPPVFDDELCAFVPGNMQAGYHNAGACNGSLGLDDALIEGAQAGAKAAASAGFSAVAETTPPEHSLHDELNITPLWRVPADGKQFVDFQHDVTASDIELAYHEGFVSVEHMKRYTTLGMANDQGKTSNVNALAIMAEQRRLSIPEVGTTRFRPPTTPVAMGAFAGREIGTHFRPLRRTPMQSWHEKNGAVFVETGAWRRAQYYPIGNEGIDEAYVRETAHVREKVGMVDVTTLGKIDVMGPDAGEFLNRVYTNAWKKMPVGKARYGLMLREDGIVYDDGTTSRIAENHYFMTTTTANAAGVLVHLEKLLQTEWQDLRVKVTSVSEQWAGMAVAGPRSRAVLEAALDDIDMSDAAFPFMGVREGKLSGMPVRVLRISFSGEMAYEVYTPAHHGEAVWCAIMDAGKSQEIIPYGTEALGALRIEKGHVAGPELDGRTTLADMGLAGLASKKKYFVGKTMMSRPGLEDENRPRLVGLKSKNPEDRLKAGAILLPSADMSAGADKQGHVTSITYSPAVGGYIALGYLRGGLERTGETVYAAYPLRDTCVEVEVCHPCFYDQSGERMKG